jgi:transcriptional regulator with XRE-family HTH domain
VPIDAVAIRNRGPSDLQTVAERLVWAREALGLTQTEFAVSAGVSPPLLSRWVNTPETPPAERSLKRIARKTGISLGWLRSGEGEPFEAVEHVFADPATGWIPGAGSGTPAFDGGLRVRRVGDGPPAEEIEQRYHETMRQRFAARLNVFPQISEPERAFLMANHADDPPPSTRLHRRMEVARRALEMAGLLYDFGQWDDFELGEDDLLELTREEIRGLKVGVRTLLSVAQRSLPGGGRSMFSVEEAVMRRGALLDEMVDISKVYKDVLAKVKPVVTGKSPTPERPSGTPAEQAPSTGEDEPRRNTP